MSDSYLSIFKRDNGVWYILYKEEGRIRWKSTGETTRVEALRKLSDFKQLLRVRPKTKTVSVFTTAFLSFARQNYARPTVDIFSIALGHLKRISGDCLLTSLTAQHPDRYKVTRLADKVSGVTVNVELRGLRAVMNVALRWKLVSENPFAKVELVRVPDVPPVFLTKAHFQKLVSLIKEGWLRDVVFFAVSTGMRRGEILNLRWEQIDLPRRLIHVQSNPTFKTKQGKRRTLPLNEVAFQLLSNRVGRSASPYVFTARDEKVAESYLSHSFKDYARLAGLSERVHFHSLRHTFASWLVQDGVSLYEVQKLLGHSNIAVTQVYSHLQPEGLHSTVNRISIALN